MCGQFAGGILDFCSIYRFYGALVPDGLAWLALGLAGASLAAVAIGSLMVSIALYTWFERRGLGRFQSRLGPNRWGPFGMLQPFADVLKLLLKEDTVPGEADRPVFSLAPVVFLAPTLLVIAVVPVGAHSFLGRLNIGLLFLVAVTSVNTLAVFMAGWGSRNRYAILGATRAVAMLVSYEVPMGLAIVGVALLSGSLALADVVDAQDVAFFLVQPLGFLVFLAAASAEMNRTPFDLIEAESELVGGYNTEYSGAKFALFMTTEFGAPVVGSILVATLFLGGWRGLGPVPGVVWLGLKVLLMVSFLMWLRATWPRLRVDQVMGFAWKGLFPLALINLFAVAVEIRLLQDPATGLIPKGGLWAMAAINWVVAVAAVVVLANVLGQRRLTRPAPVASPLANMRGQED